MVIPFSVSTVRSIVHVVVYVHGTFRTFSTWNIHHNKMTAIGIDNIDVRFIEYVHTDFLGVVDLIPDVTDYFIWISHTGRGQGRSFFRVFC